MGVELFIADKLFQAQMHTVTPVVARDGGDVDPFIGGIALITHISVRGKPVLKGQDGKHGGRFHVLSNHKVCNPGLAEVRGVSLAAKHLIVELLGGFAVLFPPCPER